MSALGGSVTLYIDGMKADEREMRQLRPEDVERVLYMDAPSGRYAGDNVALNFIMKKRTSGGYVALDAMQCIGYTNGDYNLAAKYFAGNTHPKPPSVATTPLLPERVEKTLSTDS